MNFVIHSTLMDLFFSFLGNELSSSLIKQEKLQPYASPSISLCSYTSLEINVMFVHEMELATVSLKQNILHLFPSIACGLKKVQDLLQALCLTLVAQQ